MWNINGAAITSQIELHIEVSMTAKQLVTAVSLDLPQAGSSEQAGQNIEPLDYGRVVTHQKRYLRFQIKKEMNQTLTLGNIEKIENLINNQKKSTVIELTQKTPM